MKATKKKCKWCGEEIYWDGKKWQHSKGDFRHPALPKKEE